MNKLGFIYGCISFRAAGGFSDLFIRECRCKGVFLYNIAVDSEGVTASVKHSDLRLLYTCAQKSGMEIEILSRRGLPHLIIRYRKRLGVPVGLLLFSMILLVLHSVIWSVDISETQLIPEEDIISALQEIGIEQGSFCEAVNSRDAEFVLYQRFPDISWVSVQLIATRVFVNIRENSPDPQEKLEQYSNIVALKDGEIESALIMKGEGQLYKGTAVVKGDLLVAGIRTLRDGSVLFVDSEAVILARTKNYITSSVRKNIPVSSVEKCKDIYFISFFGLRVPLGLGVKTERFTENTYFLDGGDVTYPVGIVRENRFELSEVQLQPDDNMLLLLALSAFARSCGSLYERAQILDRSVSISTGDELEICGEFLCIEDIGQKKSFTVEETS